MPTLTANERIGTLVGGGRYKILNHLGEGGFSAVFVAEHTVTGRNVALKILHPHLVATEAVSERFLDEARAMARIRHEGIVQVFDAGRDPDGTVFIALELQEGESLENTLVRVGRLTWGETVAIGVDVLDALAEAHRNGIIHRDIKPGNIFIVRKPDGSSQARLLDFGIAHIVRGRDERLTEAGMILGTPEYMSPEQGRHNIVDPASDIWSVGIVMYECIVGETPFTGATTTEVLLKVAQDDPPLLRERDPTVPLSIAAVIDRSLSRDLAVRYSAATQMREAFLGARASADAFAGDLRSRLRAPTLPSGTLKAQRPVPRRPQLETMQEARPAIPPITMVLSAPLPVPSPVPSPAPSVVPSREPSALLQSNVAVDQQPTPEDLRTTSGVHARDDASAGRTSGDRLAMADPFVSADASKYAPPSMRRQAGAARPTPQGTGSPPRDEWRSSGWILGGVVVGGLALLAVALRPRATPEAVAVAPAHAAPPESVASPETQRASRAALPLVVQATIPLPATVVDADNAAEFARHTAVSPFGGTTQRVAVTCVPGADGVATAYLFAMVGGGPLATSRGEVACAGFDLAVVPDMTGDAIDDVVSVAPGGNAIVVLDSHSLRPVRSIALPHVRGLASGLTLRNERVVLAYTEPGGAIPSALVAVALASQSVVWRVQGVAPLGRVGDPVSLGLSVGPDATGDGVPDVVAGIGSSDGHGGSVSRCVLLVSGRDGRPVWPAPYCQHVSSGAQSVSLGPDIDGDGRGDIAVGTDGPAAGDPRAVLLSGADAHVLRSISAPVGDGASGFGWPIVLGGDVDGDGAPDVVVGSIGEGTFATVFSAANGHRVAQVPLGGVGAGYLRLFTLPPAIARGRWSVVIADPGGGIRMYTVPEEPSQ